MKYIVLSFDDGLIDFKKNALPVLEKYGVKATVNIVSGFADGSVESEYKCMSVEDVRDLYKMGHEIALHSDSHINPITIREYERCFSKICDWIGCDEYGIALPFSQKISPELLEYFKKNNFLYLCDYPHKNFEMSFRGKLFRIKNHFLRTEKGDLIVYGLSYNYKAEEMLNQGLFTFKRFPVGPNVSAEMIFKIVDLIPDNSCITLMFHSVLSNYGEDCMWGDGAWSKFEFEKLVSNYSKDKQCRIITQKELLYVIRGKNKK